jgi:FkbM family methyltransferase
MAELEFWGNEIGGRWIATDALEADMTIFSFGVGEDISFELECLKRGYMVFCFDPTPRSIAYINPMVLNKDNDPNLKGLYFRPIGISNVEGVERFYYPKNKSFVSCSFVRKETDEYFEANVYTLKQIIESVGRKPDIVKLDIEGAEYGVIDSMHNMNYPKILMVEFHGDKEADYANLLSMIYNQVFQNGHDYLFI